MCWIQNGCSLYGGHSRFKRTEVFRYVLRFDDLKQRDIQNRLQILIYGYESPNSPRYCL